jgi:hypothetical protein
MENSLRMKRPLYARPFSRRLTDTGRDVRLGLKGPDFRHRTSAWAEQAAMAKLQGDSAWCWELTQGS